MPDPLRVLKFAADTVADGQPAALCAIVARRGSAPQTIGTLAVVDPAGEMTGTLGGGCVEADVRGHAMRVLESSGSEVLTFRLDMKQALDEGMVCGGEIDVAIRTIDSAAANDLATAVKQARAGEAAEVPMRVSQNDQLVEYQILLDIQPKLVVVGGGHVGRLVAEYMIGLGFQVSVLDDREEFANPQRFPPPIEPTVGEIEPTLREWPIDDNTYLVIVTRGHLHDERALRAVLDTPARFIGMIGSKRKAGVIFNDLKRDGFSKEQLLRVHSPVGIAMTSVTTEEIALSIAAQLVDVRRSTSLPVVTGPHPVA
ncbi:MAG: XdhC family protein [Planctomycetota bacterium]